MSCKHPKKGFKVGLTVNGKPDYLRTSYKVDHVEKIHGKWIKAENKFISPFAEKVIRESIDMPCGNCIACRLEYSRQWANRCLLELTNYDEKSAWFVTLTYAPDAIQNNPVGFINGQETYSLYKRDLQLFFKNLRRQLEYYNLLDGDKIRYYACGEYGSQTFRPHYHAIIYGLKINDLTFFQKSKKGYPLYRSEFLEKVWNKGIVCIGDVSWDTCAYTARYVMKKQKGINAETYYENGIEPEFCVMSRRPGIGRDYYDLNKEQIYKFDEIILNGGNKIRSPRYYDKLFEIDYPELYKDIKEKRKENAVQARNLKMCHTDKTYEEMLLTEEQILINRIKALRRNDI